MELIGPFHHHYHQIHHQDLKGSQQYGDFALLAHVLPSDNA
jgi:hypothetical protein